MTTGDSHGWSPDRAEAHGELPDWDDGRIDGEIQSEGAGVGRVYWDRVRRVMASSITQKLMTSL